MDYPKYIAEANSNYTVYKFISNGTNGQIEKAIKYSPTSNDSVYNLAFGDIILINEDTGEIKIDDKAISDNGDRDVVLATVADSALKFTEKYPDKILIFSGSTPSRTSFIELQ